MQEVLCRDVTDNRRKKGAERSKNGGGVLGANWE